MKPQQRRELALQQAIHQGLIDSEQEPLASFLDRDAVRRGIDLLHQAFPSHLDVLHTFAVKANSLTEVIDVVRQSGMGAEVASDGELSAALEAGVDPEKIVYDSPAKTRLELRRALDLGVAVNIDNFQELARINELLDSMISTSPMGMRINPVVGSGSIEQMSTATVHSKFGVPMRSDADRQQIIEAYRANPRLQRVHCHVGSQGVPLEKIAEGIHDVVALADEINEGLGHQQITTIDIGGGLPVNFDSDDPYDLQITDYVAALQEGAPRLFSGDYSIVTEFGRSILAKHGFIVSYVEYTKEVSGRRIAITHAGAQIATRTVFMPEAWPLRVECFDHLGESIAEREWVAHDVAGPCCFAGDLVAQNRRLPIIDQGDIVMLLDTGAYYASNPFAYNSLPRTGVYWYDVEDGAVTFDVIRAPEEYAIV